MRHPYNDITDEITRLLREKHRLHGEGWGGLPAGCTGGGSTSNDDCRCVAKPLWWDEFGVPRFAPHSPLLCPVIGATEVALILVACQSCAREFPVQMSWDRTRGAKMLAFRTAQETPASELKPDIQRVDAIAKDLVRNIPMTSLAYQIAGKGPHYGDPPYHDGCRAGNTMNVWDLRVLEFWRRREGSLEYIRIPELEVPLPDMTDVERVGPS